MNPCQAGVGMGLNGFSTNEIALQTGKEPFAMAGKLPSGNYSLWVQETAGLSYGFDFVISSVTSAPEPDVDVPLLAGFGPDFVRPASSCTT